MKITKETLRRALRTFIQALIAYLVVALNTFDLSGDTEEIKKAALGLLIPAIAAGLSAVMNLEKSEQLGGSSGVPFSKWVKTHIGKKTDWDGCYGVQCVDLADCYINECLGLDIGFFGNAKYWWLNREKSAWLKKHFDFITPKYKNGELLPGDIGIRTSGTYGHIFIIAEPTACGKVKYYDQNATGNGNAMALREREYNALTVTGILRPKNRSNLIEVPNIKTGEYVLTNVRGVYNGAGAATGRKKVSDLTADGRKNATAKSGDAYLKAGTTVTILETKLVSSGNLWARIPSGWLCVWEKDKSKKFIK